MSVRSYAADKKTDSAKGVDLFFVLLAFEVKILGVYSANPFRQTGVDGMA